MFTNLLKNSLFYLNKILNYFYIIKLFEYKKDAITNIMFFVKYNKK